VNPEIGIFLGLSQKPPDAYKLIQKHNLLKKFKLRYFYPGIQTHLGYYRFSPSHVDFSKAILACATGSVYALMLGLFMGFEKNYLLGIDHSYLSSSDPASYRLHESNRIKDIASETANDLLIRESSLNSLILKGTTHSFDQYNLLRNNCRSEIINLSPEGILDLFPKARLEDIL
jgi:hypothetical protein